MYTRLYMYGYNVYNACVRYRVTRAKRDDLISLKFYKDGNSILEKMFSWQNIDFKRKRKVRDFVCIASCSHQSIVIRIVSMYRNVYACTRISTCSSKCPFICFFDDPSIAWAHFICMCNYWSRSCLMVRYAAHRLLAATAKRGSSLSSVCPDSPRLCRYDVRRDKSVHKEIDWERFNQVQLPLTDQQFSQIEKK